MEKEKKIGIVKWFSEEKGYGFVTDKTNNDLYFGVKDVVGADLPINGDKVKYEEYVGEKNTIAAKEIIILEKKNPDFIKMHCEKCDSDVKPKPWHFGGTDYTNIKTAYLCPNCGNTLHESGGGFNKLAKFILIFIAISITAITFILAK